MNGLDEENERRSGAGKSGWTLLRIVFLAVFTLVATVLVLELAMQATALLVGTTVRDPVTDWVRGDTRVLALGDSNTYGLYLPAEHSYPRQLEALWNSDDHLPGIQVVNLGYPGTNSSVLRANLPRLLDTFAPDIVLIMVGVNDFWTDVVHSAERAEGICGRIADWLRDNSRVYKLIYMVRRSFFDPSRLQLGPRERIDPDTVDKAVTDARRAKLQAEIDAGRAERLWEVRYGDETFTFGGVAGSGDRGNAEILAENLRRLVHEIRDAGSQAILLTYPSSQGWYQRANEILVEVARQAGAPLCDVAAELQAHCANSRECPDLFFPDDHATQAGNAIAARLLKSFLRDSGVMPGGDDAGSVEP